VNVRVCSVFARARGSTCPIRSRSLAQKSVSKENLFVRPQGVAFESPFIMVRSVAPIVFGDVPRAGDRILILRGEWLELILDGQKDLEIRGAPLSAGDVWLGTRGVIRGRATLGRPGRIHSKFAWHSLRARHLVQQPALPYKKTYGLPLTNVSRVGDGIPYVHPRGAIGIVKYRPYLP
jgi:hypothetical protein